MRLEHYPTEKLTKEIVSIIGKRLDLSKYRVFFFGSRVIGKGTDRSDIDVGIEGPEPVPDKIFLEIEEEIDKLPTLYTIEIVDFFRVPPKFHAVAKQSTEALV